MAEEEQQQQQQRQQQLGEEVEEQVPPEDADAFTLLGRTVIDCLFLTFISPSVRGSVRLACLPIFPWPLPTNSAA